MSPHTLDRGQAELLGDLGVLDSAGLLEGHAADELGEVRGRSNGGTAAKRLELDVGNCVVIWVNTDLELHDIATCRSANEAGADVAVVLGHAADIAGLVVVVEQC